MKGVEKLAGYKIIKNNDQDQGRNVPNGFHIGPADEPLFKRSFCPHQPGYGADHKSQDSGPDAQLNRGKEPYDQDIGFQSGLTRKKEI